MNRRKFVSPRWFSKGVKENEKLDAWNSDKSLLNGIWIFSSMDVKLFFFAQFHNIFFDLNRLCRCLDGVREAKVNSPSYGRTNAEERQDAPLSIL